MRRSASIIPPLLLAWCLGACGAPDDPRDVAAAYLDDLARGRLESAFERLAPGSRARLERAEIAWIRGEIDPLGPSEPPPEGTEPSEGRVLYRRLLAGGTHDVPLLPEDAARRVGPARREGDLAFVEITTPLGTRELALERHDGTWRVRLKLPG